MNESIVPKYNPESVNSIEDDGMVDGNDAVRVAATTMDGAYEDEGGGIHATQTGCNVLNYDEHVQPSQGALEGKRRCQRNLKEFLEKEGLDSVDEWISKNSK